MDFRMSQEGDEPSALVERIPQRDDFTTNRPGRCTLYVTELIQYVSTSLRDPLGPSLKHYIRPGY